MPAVPSVLERPLVDGHCHTVFAGNPDRARFELWCTEADRPAPEGVAYTDTPLVLALRHWCTPALGLPPRAPLDDYLERRADLGVAEVSRRLLSAAKLSDLLVDTGIGGDGFCRPADLGVAGARVHEVVRLEAVAERLATTGIGPADFADAFHATLDEAIRDAVAVKSILAYRHGFDVDPSRPATDEVTAAARRWLSPECGRTRVDDPVLLRFLLWSGVDTGLPLQLHTGFGDRDLRLPSANPALLQAFLELAEPRGTPIVLLHCYPYHREAGWLAAVYPQVHVDVGLTLSHVGARAEAVLAEFCEVVPFGKLLFSTDAYGLPELYCLGAAQFRHAFGSLLTGWWRQGALETRDLERIGALVGGDNARRVYGLR